MKNKRWADVLLKLITFAAVGLIMGQACLPVHIYAESGSDEEKVIEEQVRSDEAGKIEDQLDKYSGGDVKEIIPGYDPKTLLEKAAKGKLDLNPATLINGGLKYLFKELYTNLDILVKLIVLVVLCAVLRNLQTSFLSQSVGELAFFACYIVIVTVVLMSFNTALDLGRGIIDSMVAFMQATVPVLITLLVSSGNITSGGVFQPILISIVEIAGTVMRNLFIPLIFLSTILSIVDNISDKIQISKLAAFLKQISGWALGLMLTIFIGVVSIQGSLGAVVDGVTSKTAKFAIGAFIPVAGKYLADAADAIIGCTLLIKNAAGVAVMVGIMAICIVPLLKMFALILLYRITCVLIEPISEKRITACISEVAGSLTFIMGIVAAVAFMFLLSVTAIISASNISTMIR